MAMAAAVATFENYVRSVLRTFENFRVSRIFSRSFFKILIFKILVLVVFDEIDKRM